MTYEITTALVGEELYQVDVAITLEDGSVVDGQTHICVATEQEARDYAEHVFLPDLRRNNKKLVGLVLAWESEEEPIEGGEA